MVGFCIIACYFVQDYRSSQPGEGDKEVQILIPQPFMGTIIGTGGTKIKDLRTVSVCVGVGTQGVAYLSPLFVVVMIAYQS